MNIYMFIYYNTVTSFRNIICKKLLFSLNICFSAGYYMYIETSAPVKPGDKARLISPGLNGAAQFCITFWYHMYGPHINALNVYLAQNTTLGTPVWRRSGTQGNKWNKGTFTIQGGSATAAVTNVGLITI